MPVSMAKTPSHTASSKTGTKVPFKKVFSSSHLQTNGINGGHVNEHKSHPRGSNDFGSMLTHPNLSSQLSSSLPGFLDNVNPNQAKRGLVGPPELVPAGAGPRRSSQKSITSVSSGNAVIDSLSKSTPRGSATTLNIPFSAIEPSLIVSLSTYLNSLKNFDSEKLIKEIHLMLTYFEDVVKKDKLEQLVGACTILMDTVDANCAKLKNTYLQLQQVQLRLQLLLQSLDDESETLAKIRSSPVIEANNDLYRKMAELLQWSDQVSTLHRLIEDGDRRIHSNEGSPSPERGAPAAEQSREMAKANNIQMAHEVSRNLLDSFENLVKAYKNMEDELRLCYEEYSHANKQMVDLILSESSSTANRSLHSMRRRSITPPPDYPGLSSSGSGSHRVPNGSTSTIASSTSSSSSNSSHFRHRFFPTLTNHAQKMAHKMLSKNKKDSQSPVSAKADGVTGDKHSPWSLWPLLGSNLRRSESASDISLPRASYLDIPEENHGKPGSRNRSPSPFRKHSINEQIISVTSTNSNKLDSITLPSTPIREKISGSRKSSTSQVNRHSDGNTESGRPPPSAPFGVPAKEMLINPLYFTGAQLENNTNSQSSDSLVQTPVNMPGSQTSPSSSPGSTHSKYSTSSTQNGSISRSPAEAVDKPPPLPPKTYQSRSMSSTRSSIASNTSSSSASSKDCHRPCLKDTDSGLGTIPANSTCDLDTRNVLKCVNHTHGQSHHVQSPLANGQCDHRRAICTQTHVQTVQSTCNHHCSPNHNTSCQHLPTQPMHHHCCCQVSPPNGAQTEMNSQVTLRPKKNRGRTHKCDYNCERAPSPPPLPPPDSIIFSLDTVVPLDSGIKCDSRPLPNHCCCHNKENYIINCNVTCGCGQPISPSSSHCTVTCQAHASPVCSCQAPRQVRTYRKHEQLHKTQSVQFTKSMRSYSIAETSSSTLKSSVTSLTVDCSNSMTHSSSFPHRLSHSAGSCDSGMPPPLPPKKRNMNAYMLVVGNYSGPSEPAADFYRFSAANFTKSMIETKSFHSIRQNSTTSSVSAMSLSSSASSSSSLCTTASSTSNAIVTTVADHMDKQQYLHLPIAPPPPSHRENTSSSDKSPTPPPRLPPRRDKLNELPLAPPPPPPVSSSSVIQQRIQQQQVQNNFPAEQPMIVTPRSSTPIKHSEVCFVQTDLCSCHKSAVVDLTERPKEEEESVEFVEKGYLLEEEEMTEEVQEDGEELPMMVEELEGDDDSGEPKCCTICSDGTVHSEAECVLSQTDVPSQLLTLKTKEDDDDLGDLAIRAGTADALLVKATQASAAGADATFLHTFLNTYRSFATPEQLIDKLIFRYNQFSLPTEKTDIVRQAVASKVVAFIVLVVNEFYLYDFSKALSHRLMEFIYQLVGRGDLAHAKCLREKCYEKLRQRDREFAAANTKLTSYNITTRTATLLDFKSEHIAEQMTLLDSRLFHKIEIPEILIWAKEQKEELIPNLNRFTEHFNKMSFWARSQILACEDQKEREKYVLKFLKIMKNLKKLNNFNSYLSLLAALASAPISRLEWPKNIMETFKEYHALIDSSSSFRTYRTVLANTKPPCIPYIGLILQDLTFVHIGNNDYLPDGKVNFAKHFKQFSILSQMKQFQQCKYTINENEHIIEYFDSFDNYLQDEVMWQISESIKPRGGGSNSVNANAN